MKLAKAAVSLFFTLGLIFFLDQRMGTVPPVGKFLDPFSGFWQNAETANAAGEEDLPIPGLKEPVSVAFDDRGVPHIFAQNDHDLYLAQGYITARDRLWQMEFQTHAAAGRVSEIVGGAGIEFDRFHRRLGMVHGAQNVVKGMQDTRTWESVEAYSEGVNAYIGSLNSSELPIEYKILDYKPEPWTPLKVGLMVMNLANTLTSNSSDLEMTNTLNELGAELTEKLFPKYAPYFNPAIPESTEWDFEPKQVRKPDTGFVPNIMENGLHIEHNPGIGSNNWAVDGSKTESGNPMLANDPHLNLTLPSLWYEVQLYSPTVNVYGVSLPGAPAVIIGFNEDIAWGVTNTGADVLDIYEIEFQDETRERYLHDGVWKPTQMEVEEIKVRGGETVLDTIVYTHHGPITLKEGEEPFRDLTAPEHAIRWLAHDESNEVLTFLKINRAKNYDEFVDGIKHHHVPAQTYAYADTEGNIALWSNGLFPLRWNGQGDYISDGRDPLYDWQGWIPHEQNPHHKNPERGFVSSANQPQVGPDYPYYLGWMFAPNERGVRLDELLGQAEGIDKNFMQQMQNDNLNVHARSILPFMLEKIDTSRLDTHQQEIFTGLREWDYQMDPDSKVATMFHFWWRELYRSTWEKVYGDYKEIVKFPARDHTVFLMKNEPESDIFIHESDGYTLTLDDFIIDSFTKVEGDLIQEHGEFSDNWNWGKAQGANIKHLADIPGFDSGHLLTGGDDGILNAIRRGDNGPSWRMVVDLGQPVQGYGIYPGGQSGNPGSKQYDQFVDDWVDGELYELLFLSSPEEEHESIKYRLNLKNN
ncbi:MAG: penicillin acylase family protein [Balneolales bacterium]